MSFFRTFCRTAVATNSTFVCSFRPFAVPKLKQKRSRSCVAKSPQVIKAIFQNAFLQNRSGRRSLVSLSSPRRRKGTRYEVETQKLEDMGKPEASGEQSASAGPFRLAHKYAKQELKALVDYYGIELDTRPEEEPSLRVEGKLIWTTGDMHQPWPVRNVHDLDHIASLEALLKIEDAPHDLIFETYKKLKSPGVIFLRIEVIRALLHHLSVVERPSPPVMQRFLSILDDMKVAQIHISRAEWTSAIHLTGRAMGKVSDDDVQSAMQLWRDMEIRAGVPGGYVTFNVLFNVAVKAGKYTLAESLVKEMEVRKVTLHRHFRVSLIYYYGILQNGSAVRRAFQDFVDAGEVVDTVVLNSVMAAFIRAGEPAAAEHIFERMKRLHAHRDALAHGRVRPYRHWRIRRIICKQFAIEARHLQRNEDHQRLQDLQNSAPVAPDGRTYGILIRYQASKVGNIYRVNELLQEMRYNSVPMDGSIFIVIFHGFNFFGGVRYTSWTANKLEKIWAQYLEALRDELERTWLSSLAVIAALRAFGRCTSPEKTLAVWQDIRKIWNPTEEELENVLRILRTMIPGPEKGFFNENVDYKM